MSSVSKKAISLEYEAGLAVLDALTPSGFVWSAKEIADIIGCNQEWVNRTTRMAKRKLQRSDILKQHFQDISAL